MHFAFIACRMAVNSALKVVRVEPVAVKLCKKGSCSHMLGTCCRQDRQVLISKLDKILQR